MKNVFPIRAILFIVSGIFFIAACNPSLGKKGPEKSSLDRQEHLLQSIDRLLEQRQYQQARCYLNLLQEKMTRSPLADDVAYRLAYLHVIDDSLNPYFDYEAALTAFQRFSKKFPQSRYSSACNNWLKILYLVFDYKRRCKASSLKVERQHRKILELENKNKELKRTLKDLEKVIKRND